MAIVKFMIIDLAKDRISLVVIVDYDTLKSNSEKRCMMTVNHKGRSVSGGSCHAKRCT